LLLFEDADLGAYLDCRLDGESLVGIIRSVVAIDRKLRSFLGVLRLIEILIIGYCNYRLLDSQLSILFM
jgi:hypothetical protein